MTTEERNKRNEAIALFMGLIKTMEPDVFDSKIVRTFFYSQGHPGNPNYEKETRLQWHQYELHYNTSWDWLMPVVEKIDSLGFYTLISKDRAQIFRNSDYSGIEVSVPALSSKIEAVFLAVSDFCINYNQSKL